MTDSDMIKGMNSIEPFFIIGAQRSGTTLLRLMLNAHSRIAIPEEGTFWMPLLRKYGSSPQKKIHGHRLRSYLDYIKNNPQFRLWGCDQKDFFEIIERREHGCTLAELMVGLYSGYARYHGKSLFGDKTPSFFRMVPALNQLFPDARFINLVRDGRDIYLSAQKMDSAGRNISVAAMEWNFKVRQAARALQGLGPERRITVRYEDLIGDPHATLEKICNFLMINFESAMLDYWRNSNRFIGAHHSDLIFRPVSSVSIEKWRKQLSMKEIGCYQLIAGNTLRAYGYEIDRNAAGKFQSISRVVHQLICGLPSRALQVLYTAFNLNLAARFGLTTDAAGKGDPPQRLNEKEQ